MIVSIKAQTMLVGLSLSIAELAQNLLNKDNFYSMLGLESGNYSFYMNIRSISNDMYKLNLKRIE